MVSAGVMAFWDALVALAPIAGYFGDSGYGTLHRARRQVFDLTYFVYATHSVMSIHALSLMKVSINTLSRRCFLYL